MNNAPVRIPAGPRQDTRSGDQGTGYQEELGATLIMYGSRWKIRSVHVRALSIIPYDTVKDFERVVYVANAPLVLVVHSSVPVSSVQELIALAKSKPGELNYATSGVGTTSFLASELFRYMTGVRMVHVPYKGAGATAAAVISGQVQMAATIPNATVPQIRAGRVRALGVTSSWSKVLKEVSVRPE